MAAHLCLPTAFGWKAKVAHPSKPCRTTSALSSRAYASAGQAGSALHTMAVLQVFQAKLFQYMDESDPDAFRDLRSTTDLALCATKTTAQAIDRAMASLVVLERHVWLNLTEIKDTDKAAFFDSPVFTTGLFGPAVDSLAKCFTAAQKSLQAMRHFLSKSSSSAAALSRQKSMPTQQPAKPAPATAQPKPVPEPQQCSHSTKHFPTPKHQCYHPKITLDPEPQKPS